MSSRPSKRKEEDGIPDGNQYLRFVGFRQKNQRQVGCMSKIVTIKW